jgi:hypothetical protein
VDLECPQTCLWLVSRVWSLLIAYTLLRYIGIVLLLVLYSPSSGGSLHAVYIGEGHSQNDACLEGAIPLHGVSEGITRRVLILSNSENKLRVQLGAADLNI